MAADPIMDIKIEGLDGLLDRMKKFPKEMAVRGGPIRAALAAGGKIVREEAKANVRKIIQEPNKGGLDSASTGLLEKNIIQKRHRDPKKRDPKASEIYSVRVRRKKTGKGVDITRYAKILEFGSEHISAKAWLRNAAASKRQEAIQVIAKKLAQGIAKIERKLGGK